jgi:hypothetical protein
MAGYSLVKDENGNVCGFWLQDPEEWLSDAEGEGAMKYLKLQMLIIKHHLPQEVFSTILDGNFRLVPNKVDNNGGKFLMFGSTIAPGESGRLKSWWKFW